MENFTSLCSFQCHQSGNRCDVYLDLEVVRRNQVNAIRVEWDSYPPSRRDVRLWSRKFFPVVCRKLAKLMPDRPSRILSINSLGEAILIDGDTEKRLGTPDRPGWVN